MPAPGQKAKLVNLLDHQLADDLTPLYSIEVALTKSPNLGVKCGAIVVFKLNDVTNELEESLKPKNKTQMRHARAALQEISDQVNKMTDVMHRDPVYFKETEGRWIGWAAEKALEIFDQLGGNADITVKSSKLRIRQKVKRADIVVLRSNPRELFSALWDIDRLLDKDFSYDPWKEEIRRGRIGADMAKR